MQSFKIVITELVHYIEKNNSFKTWVWLRIKIWCFDVHRVMKPVGVAKILQEALYKKRDEVSWRS